MKSKNFIINIQKQEIDLFKVINKNFNNIKRENFFRVQLKNKKLFIIICGEKIYIKCLKLPKVNKKLIKEMIKEELKFYFKNMDNILYDYSINKEDKDFYEIMVFCIKSNVLNNIKDKIQSSTIKRINLIQFLVLDFIKKIIDEEKYIIIFKYRGFFYYILIINGLIKDNVCLKEEDYLFTNNILKDFNKNSLKNDNKICKTYFLNIINEELQEDEINYFKSFINIKINIEDIIKKYLHKS